MSAHAGAIGDVMLRYAKAVDERDFTLLRSLFAEDVEVLGFAAEAIPGVDAWLEFVTAALATYGPTQHLLGPSLVEAAGDRAHARTDVQALHFMKDDPGATLTLWATYETDLVARDGEWRIVRHELVTRGRRFQSDESQR